MTETKQILIIEDEKPVTYALDEVLRGHGCALISTTNGQEGLALALKLHPDLIVLDMIMPIMDGPATLENLRRDEWGKNAKVLILTNLTDDEKKKKVLAMGALGYIVKSDISISELGELIQKLLV